MKETGRVGGLDGLRGVAALVVLVHHTLLLTPALFAVYQRPDSPQSALVELVVASPLHLLWDGPAAVYVFFVLSGFVLTRMLTRDTSWLSYYPSRIIRLYLPVWAAIALAISLTVVTPELYAGSMWVVGHAPISVAGVIQDAGLLIDPGQTTSVLWSLQWEVIFSVTLPIYVAFALRARRWWLGKLFLVFSLLMIGAYAGQADRPFAMAPLFQLSVFAVGSLIAAHWRTIQTFIARLSAPTVTLVILLALFLLLSYWLAYAVHAPRTAIPATRVLQVAGAAMVVMTAGAAPQLTKVLSKPWAMWLGSRSFSLYLVHEPIVTAVAHLTGISLSPIAALAITVPVSLIITEVFFRLIERPSHRLAAFAKRRIEAFRSRRSNQERNAPMALPLP